MLQILFFFFLHLNSNLARVKKDLEHTDLQSLISCCHGVLSIVVHGNRKEIPPMPAMETQQIFLLSHGSWLCIFYVVLSGIGHFAGFLKEEQYW